MWTKDQIKYHRQAASLLVKIKDFTLEQIRQNKNISEYEVQRFVLEQFSRHNLIIDKKHPHPIVAFAENTAFMHFFPKKKSKRLKPNMLILIDIWAKLKIKEAPFADITWMAYHGKKVPVKIQKTFQSVIRAKNKSLAYIERQLTGGVMPRGYKIDEIANKAIIKVGHGKNILHSTGHSLGIDDDHGSYPGLTWKNKEAIRKNLGYTIEPGIYLKGKFGIRSEIDFYVSNGNKLIVTTESQQEITLI